MQEERGREGPQPLVNRSVGHSCIASRSSQKNKRLLTSWHHHSRGTIAISEFFFQGVEGVGAGDWHAQETS